MRGFSRRNDINVYETFADLMMCVVVCFLLLVLLISMAHQRMSVAHQRQLSEANFLRNKVQGVESSMLERLSLLDQAARPGDDFAYLIDQLLALRAQHGLSSAETTQYLIVGAEMDRVAILLDRLTVLESPQPFPPPPAPN